MLEETIRGLARSHGFAALATDGRLGVVETPVFPPDSGRPDYLIVRTECPGRRPRRPVVAVALVEEVDRAARVVRLRRTMKELEHLPEALPLASLVRPERERRSGRSPRGSSE